MVKNNNKNKVSKKSIHKKAKKSIHKKAKKSLHKITKKSVKKNSILKGGANKIYMKLFLMFRKFSFFKFDSLLSDHNFFTSSYIYLY